MVVVKQTVAQTMKPPKEQNSRREGGAAPTSSESTGSSSVCLFYKYSIQSYPQEWEEGVPKQGRKSEAVLYERLFYLIHHILHCLLRLQKTGSWRGGSRMWRGEGGAWVTRAPALLVETPCLCPPRPMVSPFSVHPRFLISCETVLPLFSGVGFCVSFFFFFLPFSF